MSMSMSMMSISVETNLEHGTRANGASVVPSKSPLLTQPWQVLALLAQSKNNVDTEFWWKTTGSILGILMEEAGYDLQSQYFGLIFHLHYINPRLGPTGNVAVGKPVWRSFMTDDFSPLEYSWNWDTPKKGPKIRYAVEAIGPDAGTLKDPFNQNSTLELCDQLRDALPGTNFSLLDIMRDSFYDSSAQKSSSAQPNPRKNYWQKLRGQLRAGSKRKSISFSTNSSRSLPEDTDHSSPSSIFLAFELGQTIATKAYFVPVKAEQHGISRLEVLTGAIETLRTHGYPFEAYDKLLEFSKTSHGARLDIIGVAIDCIDPEATRYKIYVRSPESSFRSVLEMMTLGGTIDSVSSTARSELKDLWGSVLGLAPDFSETEELKCEKHETAGVLYNFDIKPRGTSVDPKLYVPVRHFASNDFDAAQGLGTYLQARGRDRYFANYMQALERSCTHRSLKDGRGFQTYIGTGIQKDGSLALCSYINQEVYHPNRRRV
ncbi:aromatic prenyltransferase [Lentithecium fluviatile CBS 122367]|uniref:Aromatic prenyltransferase n=1 Tax=Lentithecium fluviatile CBS 122367 TaxID=1168545 RepID=A0A6G1IDY8_9PLEO|nr:aromatic prenyltransferase [Lentithecium fluviatile CBS 122367]